MSILKEKTGRDTEIGHLRLQKVIRITAQPRSETASRGTIPCLFHIPCLDIFHVPTLASKDLGEGCVAALHAQKKIYLSTCLLRPLVVLIHKSPHHTHQSFLSPLEVQGPPVLLSSFCFYSRRPSAPGILGFEATGTTVVD